MQRPTLAFFFTGPVGPVEFYLLQFYWPEPKIYWPEKIKKNKRNILHVN